MGRLVEVKEFDTITCNDEYRDDDNYICIDKKEFEGLSSFIHEYTGSGENADVLDFMRIGYRRNVGDTITFKNYVGLIQVKNGFQIQVLPKISFDDGEDNGNEQTKRIFLKMLRSMKDFPSKVFNDTSLKVDRMNLYEIFINMYLQEVRQLVKHGIRSSYVGQEDNLKYYKGKLLVGKNLRYNLAHKERFYVSFEEFHPNRPENRIVKATLEKLQRLTTSGENSKEIRQLLTAFEMVEASKNYDKDFSQVVINRNTKDYEMLIPWSKVFLLNKSFTTFTGSTASKALLFPMESVYESYIAKLMKKIFSPDGWDVSSQDKGHYLFMEPRRQFALRPDIVIKKDDRTIILDTKWKKLIPNERLNYGISQADMYQMYAYSKKYRTSEIWLLYPENPDMKGQGNISFDSGDGTTVNIFFVDLRGETNLAALKYKIENGYSTYKADNWTTDESKVFVSEYEESGHNRWGLFYKDNSGEKTHLTEDFKSIVFDTETEARMKLKAIEAERNSEDSATAFSTEEAQAFAESHRWKFATTYAKTAPHEYLVKKWLSEEERLQFERLVQAIKKYSVVGYFHGHPNNYLILGDHYYWFMDYPDNMAVDLINRTTTDYLEYRDGAYYYKEKK